MTVLWWGRRSGVWLLSALLVAGCTTGSSPSHPSSQPSFEDARRQGQVFQALYLLEAQAAATGWTAALARQAGDLWLRAGDTERALALWAGYADDGDVALARRLAQGYIELQRWPEAVDALERLAALAPDDAWTQWQLGLIRIASDPQAAEAHLRAAMTERAYEPSARALLNATRTSADLPPGMAAGLVLASLEQWPYAELAFRYAADVAAPFPQALAYVALARDRQGKPAEMWMSDALELAPDDALIRYLHGLLLRALGDYVASLEALGLAVAFDPENPAYQAELASAYRLLGDLQQTEYWLQSAARVSEGDPRFSELLAQFYADEADHLTEEGVAALVDVASSVDDDVGVRAGFGWALYRAGRTDEALAVLDAALDAEPDNPRALYTKGRLLLETGLPDEGITLLRQAAASGVAPWAEEAQALLDEGVPSARE